MIEEGVEPGNEPDRQLQNRVTDDTWVCETDGELVHLIRRGLLEET
jgi:hypothetical protein